MLSVLLLLAAFNWAQGWTIPILLVAAVWSLYSAGSLVMPRALSILVAVLTLPCVLGIGLAAIGLLGAGRPLNPAVVVLIAALAVLIGTTARAVLRRNNKGPRQSYGRLHVGWESLAGSITAVAVVVSAHVKFGTSAFSWVLSGDARNHLDFTHFVVGQGGLTPAVFAVGPALSNGLVAILTLGPQGDIDIAGIVLQREALALEALSLTSIAIWCFAAAVLVATVSTSSTVVTRIAASLASFLPLAGVCVGVALRDGFLSSLLVIPVLTSVLAVSTWVWRTNAQRLETQVLLLAMCAGAFDASALWSGFALFPVLAMLTVTCALLVRRGVLSFANACLQLAAALVFGALPLLPGILTGTSVGAITIGGAIVPPSFAAFCGVLFVVAFRWLSLQEPPLHLAQYFAGSAAVVLALSWAMLAQENANRWNYYPAKLSWTWISVTIPLLVWVLVPRQWHSQQALPEREPATDSVPRPGQEENGVSRRISRTPYLPDVLQMVLPMVGMAAIFYFGSPLPSPFLSEKPPGPLGGFSIPSGWNQPSASVMNAVIESGSTRQSSKVVFWDFSDPGNDRIANFWLASYDVPMQMGTLVQRSSFAGWAYTYEPGALDHLCQLLEAEPNRSVRTSNPKLPQDVAARCGIANRVEVRPLIP